MILLFAGGALGIMVIVVGMKMVSQDQILDEDFHILLHADALGKGMNPSDLQPSYGQIAGQTQFFSLGKATSLTERIQISCILLKNWPCVTSYWLWRDCMNMYTV